MDANSEIKEMYDFLNLSLSCNMGYKYVVKKWNHSSER